MLVVPGAVKSGDWIEMGGEPQSGVERQKAGGDTTAAAQSTDAAPGDTTPHDAPARAAALGGPR